MPPKLATPGSAGRFPVVVLPDRARRTRIDFIIAGLVGIAVALFRSTSTWCREILVLGPLAIVAGVFRAFVVPVPMGAQAVLLRAGKFYKTVGPGTHFVLPWLPVSHIVAMREILFGAPALAILTRDEIRTNIDMVMTFTIQALKSSCSRSRRPISMKSARRPASRACACSCARRRPPRSST